MSTTKEQTTNVGSTGSTWENTPPPTGTSTTQPDKAKKKETAQEVKKRLNDKRKKMEGNLQKQFRYPGYVKAVLSGDTAIIIPISELRESTGPIFELNFSLTGVKAPKLERKKIIENPNKGGEKILSDEYEPDEHFAWASREYLRKRLVGKYVLYRVEYRVDDNKCYGEIFLIEGTNQVNIREECITLGWVAVNERKELEDKDYTNKDIDSYKEIKALQAEAIDRGIGIHTKNKSKQEASIRHVHRHNFNIKPNPNNPSKNPNKPTNKASSNKMAFELFEKIKNFPLHGVVEQVRDGSTLRVILIERMDEITINLSGVKCPNNKPTASNPNPQHPTPYTLEAKFFSEFYFLNRDVEVYIETLDELNNFYGSVKLVDNLNFDITSELLSRGLGYFIEWSVSKGVDINELRKAEDLAKSKKLKIWKRHVPRKEGNVDETNSRDITGKVVEVVTPSTIKVIPKGSKGRNTKIIRLSSVKVPRLFKENEEPNVADNDPRRQEKLDRFQEDKDNSVYFPEAKEFLRKKLISQTVSCLYDYDSTLPSGEGPFEYYSVYFKDQNVAIDLLENGYGKVAIHADDQPKSRSRDYQKLVYAQNKAARINKGMHTPLDRRPVHHINDLTFNFDQSKSNLYLNFLKRPGRVSGVVEHVFGATRYKVWIPSENCIVTIAVQGLYCEAPERNKNAKTSSPYDLYPPDTVGNRGLHFARDILFQRDVEVIINDVEKNGNFHGRVYFNGEDVAPIFLREGFARIYTPAAKSMEEHPVYIEAEKLAKNNPNGPLNMWEKYDPQEEGERIQKLKDEREAEKQKAPEKISVLITEIIDGSNFYFQTIGPETDQLNQLMLEVNKLNLDNLSAPYEPNHRENVFAKFSVDDKYYRGRVLSIKDYKESKNSKEVTRKEYRVLFIDYGNTETLTSESIRRIENQKYNELLPQAQSGKLLYVKCPKFSADHGQEAAELFRDLVWEKQLVGIVQYRDRTGVAHLNLGDQISKTHINAHMVKEGYAMISKYDRKVDEDNPIDPIYLKLKEEEEIAKLAKIGMWEHGTVPDSDEEREEEKMKKGLL